MTNKNNTVIYTGVTNNLLRRVCEHKHKSHFGFTSKYNINKLVYYEIFGNVNEAINREKQIKAGSRLSKLKLIVKNNPAYIDLYASIQ